MVYLDSYDEVRRVKAVTREVLEGVASERHKNFVRTCEELHLPLNQGKKLVGAVRGTLQGGDIDGPQGHFRRPMIRK